MKRRDFITSALVGGPLSVACADTTRTTSQPLRIATFQANMTPPLGSPLCMGYGEPARKILDPLTARGIILFTDRAPIVICAVDWIWISNAGHDLFRDEISKAVGTSRDRVSIHCVHQHNAPAFDFTTEEVLEAHGLGGKMFNASAGREAVARLANAAGEAVEHAQPVTHLGYGLGKVEKAASSRGCSYNMMFN